MYVLIFVAAVILSVAVVYLVYKFPQARLIFQVSYAVAIIGLGILLYKNIQKPIEFNKEKDVREEATINRLKDIRTAQVAYKDKYGKFTSSFDTLINFIKTDSFDIKRIVVVKPWDQDEISREDALKQGILKETVFKRSVKDSLFKDENFSVEKLRVIPFTGGSKFTMAAGEIMTGSQVKVKVFEVYALYDTMFKDLNHQMVVNYKDERFKITSFNGVKVGSLTEATNNAGNWEK